MFTAPYLPISSRRKKMTLPHNTEALYQIVAASSAAVPTQPASCPPSPVSCVCIGAQARLTLGPQTVAHQAPLSMGFFRQE